MPLLLKINVDEHYDSFADQKRVEIFVEKGASFVHVFE